MVIEAAMVFTSLSWLLSLHMETVTSM
jgi:hypothetical protein